MQKKSILKKVVGKHCGKGGPGSGTVSSGPMAMSTLPALPTSKFPKLNTTLKKSAKTAGRLKMTPKLDDIVLREKNQLRAERYGQMMKGAQESLRGNK